MGSREGGRGETGAARGVSDLATRARSLRTHRYAEHEMVVIGVLATVLITALFLVLELMLFSIFIKGAGGTPNLNCDPPNVGLLHGWVSPATNTAYFRTCLSAVRIRKVEALVTFVGGVITLAGILLASQLHRNRALIGGIVIFVGGFLVIGGFFHMLYEVALAA